MAVGGPERSSVIETGDGVRPLISNAAGALAGSITVPGDKSISHRALMLGAIAVGQTRIQGLLAAEDVHRTLMALRALGAGITRDENGDWRVDGVGVGGLSEPDDILDLGNSGTSVRLLAGLLASHRMTAFLTGDASLRRRPMGRVTEPLSRMGANFLMREGARLPMVIIGSDESVPIVYPLPVPSAQVKSAILLAGLNTDGHTTVVEAQPTRDHTEAMLQHFGADLTIEQDDEGREVITVVGRPELTGRSIVVPGDISSAAYPIVAAAVRPGSEVTVRNVGIAHRRIGLLETLREMGADITIDEVRSQGGEPVADLRVRGAALCGVDVPPERAPRMIDEYPALAVAAACASGATRMLGLAELRVKESDRLAMIAEGLTACGARVEAWEDGLTVHGDGRPPAGGATVAVAHDHRIAMSFLVLGTVTGEPVAVDDGQPIETSFPGFVELMNGIGARIAVVS